MSQQQFGDAYRRAYPLTVRFLLSLGARPDIAEEMAQGAWVKGWECREQLRQPEMISAWVNSIAKNMMRNRLRADRNLEELTETASVSATPTDALEAESILDRCDQMDSALLSSYYIEGYTAEEIAKRAGLKSVTIRVRLLRMRRALRSQLRRPAEPIAQAA